jgi:glycosyltransferase involved in cell wall biosynthesis
MESTVSQLLYDFLLETKLLRERVDELPKETAVELYSMYREAARIATLKIDQINPEYRAILCDTQDKILERIIDTDPSYIQKNIGDIYTPAVQGYRRWNNVELLKDKCLTGYMLAKELNTHSVMMFGTKPNDYPYAELLPGLEILYSETTSGIPDIYYKHLLEEYNKMGILILHGMYNETILYLDTFRKLCPNSKVYCGLDMNSYWMKNINWDSMPVKLFSQQCDVIATSCRSLRDALNCNPKVHFPCHWIPNGFFNPNNIKVISDAANKKNIILTVGRIGTPEKNNEELLLAFAKVSEILSGWELRLVGPIEPEFRKFINKYYETFPDLSNRVIFVGSVTDKAELYREYSQAKLFVLTSKIEGGTPNVYSEALFHGCMFITSDIDAADEITNYGELGLKYKCGDINELANSLVQLTSNADCNTLNKHIPKALAYAKRYFDWSRNAKKLAYMLYS